MKRWKRLVFAVAIILVVVLGTYVVVRSSTPTGIAYDPVDEGYCEAYGIEIDANQVNLEDIQSGETPLQDFEAEGHLIHLTGHILLSKGHFDLAEEVFQALITFDSQIPAGYIGLGDVYLQRGHTAAAIAKYERAIELGARDYWMQVQLTELKEGQE